MMFLKGMGWLHIELCSLDWDWNLIALLVFFTVIKSLNCTQASWELEKLNSDLKVHSLEQDLEKLKEECNSLRKELQNSKKKVP